METTTKLEEWNYKKANRTIMKTILRKDIERGVKFLSETSYSHIWGCTRSSALFCMELRKYIDFDLVYRVDMALTQQHHYTVRLFTKDGYTIQLKGFSFGYWGEGSRGSLAILREIGFKRKQINRIFNHGVDKVRLIRRVAV